VTATCRGEFEINPVQQVYGAICRIAMQKGILVYMSIYHDSLVFSGSYMDIKE